MIVLGIETSCDDTAAAILDTDQNTVRASIVSSQDQIHQRFGGVVPELASRQHMEWITRVVAEALNSSGLELKDIDLIGATQGPGLIGSLLVGFCYAKSLAYTLDIPYVGVDHMAGHLLSPFLESVVPLFPYLALIVSGGTTSLFRVAGFHQFELIGSTRDDAAGEAFDKIARYLHLGYPGGPIVSIRARSGDPESVGLPRAWLEEGSSDFSFSGLKTAVLNQCNRLKQKNELTEKQIDDICAAFEQAVIDVLLEKTIAAAHAAEISTIALGGGVSANRSLREQMGERCAELGFSLHLPALRNCTDNAAMIAFAGWHQFLAGDRGTPSDDVFSRSPLGR
jgi:N6-L-threonylcarbamoyladenine synthase